jgi:hypothetical protein
VGINVGPDDDGDDDGMTCDANAADVPDIFDSLESARRWRWMLTILKDDNLVGFLWFSFSFFMFQTIMIMAPLASTRPLPIHYYTTTFDICSTRTQVAGSQDRRKLWRSFKQIVIW